MTTKIKNLTGDNKEWLHQLCLGKYLDGLCYEFASALHQGIGWPMIGLMQGDVVRHVVLEQPDGVYRDVRGTISLEELGQPFSVKPPYELKQVTLEDLRIIRPVDGESIELARRLAEALLPELPWVSSKQMNLKMFADELEVLSRKTGIWIRSAVPACAPVLEEEDGIEGGYVLRQTYDGLGFTIDRYIR